MSWPEVVQKALQRTSGARFYLCALQVNPYEYLKRHGKKTFAQNEETYNASIIEACKTNGIEVIAVTDHYRVKTSESFRQAAEQEGLKTFPGFEAVSKEGIHVLCLFDRETTVDQLERYLGACGIHDDGGSSPIGEIAFDDLLKKVQEDWGGICIAAHSTLAGGLLTTLKGQVRIEAWKDPNLLACAIPGPLDDLPQEYRMIVKNKNPDYKRDRSVAIINAADVCGPDDIRNPNSVCLLKMSQVTIEGLRQAFLDPVSRIRLLSDPEPADHAELEAIAWEGGFLDGCAIHFNENLNVLIGGRGTGKSTVIESLRYVMGMEPLGEEVRKTHEGILREVIRSGTKISVLVRSHKPSPRQYLIERTFPNPAIVKDKEGNILNLLPKDIFPAIEIFGQHEVAEVARDTAKQIHLLSRFRDPEAEDFVRRKTDLRRALEENRIEILRAKKNLEAVEDKLSRLPLLEETAKRYQELGLEDRLKEQSLITREERLLGTAEKRIEEIAEHVGMLKSLFPIDRVFLSPKAIAGLPNTDLLTKVSLMLDGMDQKLQGGVVTVSRVISETQKEFDKIKKDWSTRRQARQAEYEKILRELQQKAVDGEEYVRLRRQIEALEPLKEQRARIERILRELQDKRRKLLDEWEEVKRLAYQADDKAAKKVSKQLQNRVKVTLTYQGDTGPLETLLRDQKKGLRAETFERIRAQSPFSIPQFVASLREGKESLVKTYGLTPGQADILVDLGEEVFFQIEELDLPTITKIELNVAQEGAPPVWRSMDELSTGQKATAILLLLLLESEMPLVVDQPEDDLDNRFIAESIIPRLREAKRRRQFLFTTHNANIPVLGDAELIAALEARGEGPRGNAEIPDDHLGSIDTEAVKLLVEQILEGGKEAFQTRQAKYGF